MDRRYQPRIPLLPMTLVAGLLAAPLLAITQGQPMRGAVPTASASPAIPDTAPARSRITMPGTTKEAPRADAALDDGMPRRP